MGLVCFFILIVLLAPLLWGGVYPWSISLWLLALAFVALRLPREWFRGPKWVEFSLYGILLAFIITVVLQILPDTLSLAPNSIWELASGALEHDIPKRTAADLGALIWQLGAIVFFALALWAALAVGSDYHRATYFLQWAVWGTAILAGITLTLFFADERFLLWSKRVYYLGTYTHGFVNRNSAASFLGTFTLLSFGMLIRSIRNLRLSSGLFSPEILDEFLPGLVRQAAPHAAALAIFTVGLLLTNSRAGILLTGVSLVFLMLLLFVKSGAGALAKSVSILAILGLSLWIFGNWGGRVSERIDAQGLELTTRAEVYAATRNMIMDYPWLGVGLGSFKSTFPVYRPAAVGMGGFWDKAHNTYLEIAAEMGLPFFVLLTVFWMGLFLVLMRGFFTRRQRYIYPAIGASVWLLASLHSFVDFPLQIPGHTLVVAAIIGVCAAQTVRYKRRHG